MRQLDGILDLLRHCLFPNTGEIGEDALYYLTNEADKRAPPFGENVLKHIKKKAVKFPISFSN